LGRAGDVGEGPFYVRAAHVYGRALYHLAPVHNLDRNRWAALPEYPADQIDQITVAPASWLRKLNVASPQPFGVHSRQGNFSYFNHSYA
jgi:hypothetical protein